MPHCGVINGWWRSEAVWAVACGEGWGWLCISRLGETPTITWEKPSQWIFLKTPLNFLTFKVMVELYFSSNIFSCKTIRTEFKKWFIFRWPVLLHVKIQQFYKDLNLKIHCQPSNYEKNKIVYLDQATRYFIALLNLCLLFHRSVQWSKSVPGILINPVYDGWLCLSRETFPYFPLEDWINEGSPRTQRDGAVSSAIRAASWR